MAETGKELARIEEQWRQATILFTRGKGNDLPGMVGSLWAAYNGITEMVDDVRNRRTRLRSCGFPAPDNRSRRIQIPPAYSQYSQCLVATTYPHKQAFVTACTRMQSPRLRVRTIHQL